MIVQFNGIDDCEVELLDLPIVQLMCKLHKINSERVGYWSRQSSTIYHTDIISSQYDEVFDTAPQHINNTIDEIKKLTGVEWPVRAYSGMDFAECNLLHRLFTTGRGTMSASVIPNTVRDKIFEYKKQHKPAENWWRIHMKDPEFGLPRQYPADMTEETRAQLKHRFETVNAWVHRYEDVCLVSGRSNRLFNEWGGKVLHEIFDVAWDERNHNGILVNEAVKAYPLQEVHKTLLFDGDPDHDIQSDLLASYQTDSEIDVYGLKNIIGKSYMLAWHQYDDPRHWDIARTQTISGGFTLDPHRLTNRFYNSDIFLNWLDEYDHPHDPQMYGHVPVGRISNGWGAPQIAENPPRMIFKNESECETVMQSETHRLCDDWTVKKVVFE